MNKIKIATKVAWSFLGKPYIWGGDDPMAGFDCCGLQVEILKSVGKLPRSGDWTAQQLMLMFGLVIPRQDNPKEGMLVFWHSSKNTNKIIHVEYCLNKELSIGASGGGHENVTVQDAIENNAYVKIRPFRSRKYIFGFVDPFKDERFSDV